MGGGGEGVVHIEVKVSIEVVLNLLHTVYSFYTFISFSKRVYDEEVAEEKSDKENKEKQVLVVTLVIFLQKKLSSSNIGRKEISKKMSEVVDVNFLCRTF